MVTRRLLVSLFLFTLISCGGLDEPGDTIFEVVFDPCEVLVIVPAADTSADERAGIAAGIAMWNARAGTRLTLDDTPGAARLPIGFEEAPGAFYGVYEDEVGQILINRKLTDMRAREITIAHELGHAFALRHVSRDDRLSIMNTANLTVEVQEGDVAALRELWGSCEAGGRAAQP